MNPLEIHGLKVNKDPQEFIEGIHKIIGIISITKIKSANLDTYHLNGVTKIWYKLLRRKGLLMQVHWIGKHSRVFL